MKYKLLLTEEFVNLKKPCKDAVDFVKTGTKERDAFRVIDFLIEKSKFSWVEWLLSRLLTIEGAIEWACLCAESVLPIFEAEYPSDHRPRLAIEAARGLDQDSAHAANAAYANAYANAAARDLPELRKKLIYVGIEILKAEGSV